MAPHSPAKGKAHAKAKSPEPHGAKPKALSPHRDDSKASKGSKSRAGSKPKVAHAGDAKHHGNNGNHGHSHGHTHGHAHKDPKAKYISDREKWEGAILRDWESVLRVAPKDILSDKALMKLALEQSWRALSYVSDDLLQDPEILLAAANDSWWALEATSRRTPDGGFSNKAVVLEGISQHWQALRTGAAEVRGDLEVVQEAIKHDPRALQFATKAARRDRSTVLAAVEKNGAVLKHAAHILWEDRQLVLEAVRSDASALSLAVESFLDVAFKITNVTYEIIADTTDLQDTLSKALRTVVGKHFEVLTKAVKVKYERDRIEPPDPSDRSCTKDSAATSASALSSHMGPAESQASRLRSVSDQTDLQQVAEGEGEGEDEAEDDQEEDEEEEEEDKVPDEALAEAEGDGPEGNIPIITVNGAAPMVTMLPEVFPKRDGNSEIFDLESTDLIPEPARFVNVLATIAASDFRGQHSIEKAMEDLNEQAVFDVIDKKVHQVSLLRKNALDKVVVEDLSVIVRAEDLGANREFVMQAVKANSSSLAYASEALRDDKEVAVEAMKNGGLALEFASERLRETFSVVAAAVRNNGLALRFAAPELREDVEIVLDAVKQDGRALAYAEGWTRTNREVVRQALRQTWEAAKFVLECKQPELFVEVVKQDWKVVRDLWRMPTPPTQADWEAMAAANPDILQAHELRGNRAVVLAAVSTRGLALRWASPELRDDEEVVRKAMESHPEALWEASGRLRYDKQLREIYDSGAMQARRRKIKTDLEKEEELEKQAVAAIQAECDSDLLSEESGDDGGNYSSESENE